MDDKFLILFHDEGPDGRGRRMYSLYWVGKDHIRLGKIRGQVFHCEWWSNRHSDAVPLAVNPGETERQAAHRMLGLEMES